MARTILIVDDDPVQRRLLEATVTRFGHKALVADGGEAGLAILDDAGNSGIGAVILDLIMPGTDGLAVLERLMRRDSAPPVIVQTSQGGIETVVKAMRAGAFDFVVKPASPERLNKALTDALKLGDAAQATPKDARRAGAPAFKDIVSGSPSMQRALRLAQKAAATAIPILIEGESGVGKEYVARAIQGAGGRRGKPFVTVNCGAIPDNLVESILFGHEKGSFTGATERHAGKFVEASGGTLFLDEIGDLPLDVQVKLLRAVQEGEVDPVGGRSTVKVDIRLISATHRDLLQQVKAGRFREDLFYRLNVYPIVVPPLRERRSEIAGLVKTFIARFGATGEQVVRRITPSALRMLEAFDWPGNIRELENAIFRACVLAEGETLTEMEFPNIRTQVDGDLGLDIRAPELVKNQSLMPPEGDLTAELGGTLFGAKAEPAPPRNMLPALDSSGEVRSLADVELDMIKFAIELYDGQMSEVARRLGIGRSTLYRKLKEYGLDDAEQPQKTSAQS